MYRFTTVSIEKIYAFFLAVILVWALLAFGAMFYLIQNQKTYGKLINISGQQRMLSQKTLLECKIALDSNQEADRQQLNASLARMKKNHEYLISHLPSKNIQKIYFASPTLLAEKIDRYILQIAAIASSQDKAAFLQYENDTTFLPMLNNVVTALETEYEHEVYIFILIEASIFILSAITILLVAFYLVIPAIKQIKKAKNDAEKALTVRSHFLNNVSHEIRTPLNAILGFIALLKRNEADEKTKKQLDIIHTNAESLQDLIGNILEISKINSSDFDIRKEKFDLFELVTDSVQNFKTAMSTKKINYHAHIDPALPHSIFGDALHIKQIMDNLISNALKFTSENGDVRVKATFDASTSQFRFAIKDSGIGIAPEDLETIFEPFKQADTSISRSYEGLGLGLSIVKEITALMGGSITVESQDQKGSLFIVLIPLEQVS